jgi:hypothetical protein
MKVFRAAEALRHEPDPVAAAMDKALEELRRLCVQVGGRINLESCSASLDRISVEGVARACDGLGCVGQAIDHSVRDTGVAIQRGAELEFKRASKAPATQ